MAKSLLLGVILVLIAVGYQYRAQLQSILANINSIATTQDTASKKAQSSTPAESKPGPDIKKFPDPQYYNPPFDPDDPPVYSKSGTRLITLNELAAHAHNGSLRPLWLAVMGRVYDVEKGAEHYYGPDGGYKFFTGKSMRELPSLKAFCIITWFGESDFVICSIV